MNDITLYMKELLLTLFCGLTTVIGQAQTTAVHDISQEEDSILNIVGYFCKGDTMAYTKRMAKLQMVKNDTTIKSDIQTDFMIVVRDSMDNGYRMEFIPTGFSFNEDAQEKTDRVLAEKLWELTKDTHAIFTTDEFGTVQNIENWKEIRDVIKKGINLVIDNYYSEIPALDSVMPRKRMESLMLMQFSTEDGIKASYDELESLFGLHGTQFAIGNIDKTYSSQGYPSRTIAETGYTVKEEGDMEGDYAIRSNSITTIPSNDITEIAGNILNSFSDSGVGDKIKEVMRDTLSSVTDSDTTIKNFEHFGYFFNGWPKIIYTEKTTDFSGIVQIININDIRWTRRHFPVLEEEDEEEERNSTLL